MLLETQVIPTQPMATEYWPIEKMEHGWVIAQATMLAIAVAELLILTQEQLAALLNLITQAQEDQLVMTLTTGLLTQALAATVREVQAQTTRLKGTLTLVHRLVDHRAIPTALLAMTTEVLLLTHRQVVAVTLAVTVRVQVREVVAAVLRLVLVVQAQVVALQEDQDNFLNKTHFYTPLINQLLLAGIFLSFF